MVLAANFSSRAVPEAVPKSAPAESVEPWTSKPSGSVALAQVMVMESVRGESGSPGGAGEDGCLRDGAGRRHRNSADPNHKVEWRSRRNFGEFSSIDAIEGTHERHGHAVHRDHGVGEQATCRVTDVDICNPWAQEIVQAYGGEDAHRSHRRRFDREHRRGTRALDGEG